MTARMFSRLRAAAVVFTAGVAAAFPVRCNLGEFTTTQTVTLDGRQVVTFLITSAILSPLESAVDQAVNAFFDRISDTEEE